MSFVAADFAQVFASLKPVLARHANRLSVKVDTANEYALVTQSASPFPQHKGHPLDFGSVRVGKAYVSFHLMPVYMCPELMGIVSQGLKQRMQGKSCFNFKSDPDATTVAELQHLVEAALAQWAERKWL